MTKETRKHIRLVSLVMAVAVVGVLAGFLVLAGNPGATQAHGGPNDDTHCDGMSFPDKIQHDLLADDGSATAHTCDDPTNAPPADDGGVTEETPAIPGFVIQHGGEAQQVSVNWDAVTDAHEYIVEYRACGAEPCGGTFTVRTLSAATTSYPITGLNAGTQYQVRVTARNAAGMVLAQSSSLVSTSRYLLTFTNDGVTPSRGHAQDFMPTTDAGADTTVTATVWVPRTTDPDRTDTVTVQFMSMDDTADPLAYYGIDVDDKDEFSTLGLLAVSATGTGHGELTIRPRDNNKRSFDMTFECRVPATRVYVIVYDDEVNVVERGTVTLLCPAPGPPSGETAGAECYSVTGMVDQRRDDLDLVENNHSRTVNSAVGARGIFRNTDGTLDIRNRRAEIGQDTTEVLVNSPNVQLIVTSCEPGPVYIRFLDENMEVFGTDVDEEPAYAGADVVGLDSQGKLEMNIMAKQLTAAEALMYDQYSLVETALTSTSWVQYLSGNVGTYYQGKFRFFDPCSMVDDHFFVEVYEKYGKDIRELENGKTYEKVTCVPSLQPGANELQVSFDTADVTDANTGTAVVTWEAIDDAAVYTVAVIDTTNAGMYTIHGTPAMVTVTAGDPEVNRIARFPDIVSEKRYIFAVYAEVTGGGYSALRSVILTPEFVSN